MPPIPVRCAKGAWQENHERVRRFATLNNSHLGGPPGAPRIGDVPVYGETCSPLLEAAMGVATECVDRALRP
jgi:hypothetical protein